MGCRLPPRHRARGPQVLAVTEFRADDIDAASDAGIFGEPLSDDEELLAATLVRAYRRPSPNDLAALALAKTRRATLLTGDGPLRDAAAAESVPMEHGFDPGERCSNAVA